MGPGKSREAIGSKERIDVLGLGAVAIDEILVVPVFPRADTKAHVESRSIRFGGLTGNALVAASRMGARSAFGGVLGCDEASDRVLDYLAGQGVDVRSTRRRTGVGPIRSTILIGRGDGTRTVLSERNGYVGPDLDWPPADLIRNCRVLFVDHVGVTAQARAASIARAEGIPVVADFERAAGADFPTLLELADHLIVERGFAAELTGDADPARAACILANRNRSVAVVTAGAEGCWMAVGDDPNSLHHQPAFCVEVVDTTGCGDVFHGVYAAALAEGRPLAERVSLAAAAAALNAALARIPDRLEIETFLNAGPAVLPVRPRLPRPESQVIRAEAV
ncbi:MAG: PfkB family carbohydrate kinase [Isosphaeraceae bacterium]